MKIQIINTDFLHDGKYYSQNSIVDLPPDLIKKYPRNLLAVDLFSEKKDNDSTVDDSTEMIQDNLPADLPAVRYGRQGANSDKMVVKTKNSKKNTRGKK